MHPALQSLHALRAASGPAKTTGLSDDLILQFLESDPTLGQAIDAAVTAQAALADARPELLAMAEADLIDHVQDGFVNFYAKDAVNPYVALAAKGPWVVTVYGAVVHDSGGYGMLGFGHAPDAVLDAMSQPWVMANIMTPSVSERTFDENMRKEPGHAREGGCLFSHFICMNSGSESVTVGARIADVNARIMTDPGGRYAGAGGSSWASSAPSTAAPTSPPASATPPGPPTASTSPASGTSWTTCGPSPATPTPCAPPSPAPMRRRSSSRPSSSSPSRARARPASPSPASSTTRPAASPSSTAPCSSVDSIQAGLRTWGTLSAVDYPGFEDCDPPDMETWSKALNAGQYPLSVLGLAERAAALYRVGIYGNTMTTAPRGLEVANAVLGMITPEVRQNVRDQGCNFVGDLQALQARFPDLIVDVQGTGCSSAAGFNPDKLQAIGPGSAEERCRCWASASSTAAGIPCASRPTSASPTRSAP